MKCSMIDCKSPDHETVSLDNIRELQKTHSVVVRRRVNNGNTRPRYRLEESIRFKLSNGITYIIPKGFEWDLSSVPRFLWGILPPDGDFETASLIHDFLYVTKIESRKFADDEMLKWSKAASGTNNKFSLRNLDNQIRYIAVRIFGWWIYYKKTKTTVNRISKRQNRQNMITLLKRHIKCLPILILFSCSDKITEGKIVNKFYEPPRQYTVTEYDVALKMPVVRSKYTDEAYVLVVESITKGDTITEKREVTYRIYNSYNVGDSVKFEQ